MPFKSSRVITAMAKFSSPQHKIRIQSPEQSETCTCVGDIHIHMLKLKVLTAARDIQVKRKHSSLQESITQEAASTKALQQVSIFYSFSKYSRAQFPPTISSQPQYFQPPISISHLNWTQEETSLQHTPSEYFGGCFSPVFWSEDIETHWHIPKVWVSVQEVTI